MLRIALGALLVSCTAQPPAHAAPRGPRPSRAPDIELLTIGPGDELYALFGHTALRVRDGAGDRVYNFGYSNFDRDDLIVDFLRREAMFWAAAQSYRRTVALYRREDRTVERQRLRLSPEQRIELAAALHRSVAPRPVTYAYDHLHDNCATRPRDLIDRVTNGALKKRLRGLSAGTTYRQLIRRGLAGSLSLLVVSEYVLGRAVDRPIDRWDASFLPAQLSRALSEVAVADHRPLVGPRLTVYRRRKPAAGRGEPRAGVALIGALAAALALLGGAAALLARRGAARAAGLPVALIGALLGLLSLPPLALAAATAIPELRVNELVLLLWPTDFVLVGLGAAWLVGRPGRLRWTRRYLAVRLGGVALVAVGHASGLLQQRPLIWLVVVGAPAACLWLAVRRAGAAA